MLALAALLLLCQPNALADPGHVPASVDFVSVTVYQTGLFSVAGLDDWALAVDGGVVCRSDPGVVVILGIDPIHRKRKRQEESTEYRPSGSNSRISLMVGTLAATPLPHQSTGFCLVMDNRAVLRELQFELFISNDVSSSESLVAHRLPQGG